MSETDNRLGSLLIKNRLINYHQLTQALEFQAKINNKIPLGEVLIQFGFITRSSLIESLNEQKDIKKQAEEKDVKAEKVNKPQLFTVKFGKINKDLSPPLPPTQMDESPANKIGPKISNNIYSDRSKHKPIGEIMVEKEYITRDKLTHALEYQSKLSTVNYKPIGEVLIDLNYITREDLNKALGVQPPVNSNVLGEILKQLGIIDATQLALVLSQQYSIGGKAVMIGELLLEHGFITKNQLDLALEEQKRRNNSK